MRDSQERAKTIFLNAAELGSEAQRRDYIEDQCAGDEELRREVDQLLEHHRHSGSFLESPIIDVSPTKDPALAVDAAGSASTVIGRYKLLQPLAQRGVGTRNMATRE